MGASSDECLQNQWYGSARRPAHTHTSSANPALFEEPVHRPMSVQPCITLPRFKQQRAPIEVLYMGSSFSKAALLLGSEAATLQISETISPLCISINVSNLLAAAAVLPQDAPDPTPTPHPWCQGAVEVVGLGARKLNPNFEGLVQIWGRQRQKITNQHMHSLMES